MKITELQRLIHEYPNLTFTREFNGEQKTLLDFFLEKSLTRINFDRLDIESNWCEIKLTNHGVEILKAQAPAMYCIKLGNDNIGYCHSTAALARSLAEASEKYNIAEITVSPVEQEQS